MSAAFPINLGNVSDPAYPVPPLPALPCRWVTMCLFVLISGPLGWAALIFLLLAVLVLVVVNMKLSQVVR